MCQRSVATATSVTSGRTVLAVERVDQRFPNPQGRFPLRGNRLCCACGVEPKVSPLRAASAFASDRWLGLDHNHPMKGYPDTEGFDLQPPPLGGCWVSWHMALRRLPGFRGIAIACHLYHPEAANDPQA